MQNSFAKYVPWIITAACAALALYATLSGGGVQYVDRVVPHDSTVFVHDTVRVAVPGAVRYRVAPGMAPDVLAEHERRIAELDHARDSLSTEIARGGDATYSDFNATVRVPLPLDSSYADLNIDGRQCRETNTYDLAVTLTDAVIHCVSSCPESSPVWEYVKWGAAVTTIILTHIIRN